MRVVDRVLHDAAGERTLAEPAIATPLAQVGVLVVGVRHRPDRAHAVAADVALLARAETHDDQAATPPDNQRIGAAEEVDLAGLALTNLDMVVRGTAQHLGK